MSTVTLTPGSTAGLPNRRVDQAHHHPRVSHDPRRGWAWSCSCGGRTRWTDPVPDSWHAVVVAALVHSTQLAA